VYVLLKFEYGYQLLCESAQLTQCVITLKYRIILYLKIFRLNPFKFKRKNINSIGINIALYGKRQIHPSCTGKIIIKRRQSNEGYNPIQNRFVLMSKTKVVKRPTPKVLSK